MNQIPAVGEARGVFEIFVPGLFLLVNLCAPLYFFPWTRERTLGLIQPVSSPLVGLVVFVCFGYLLGILLRLARADTPDRWSSWYLRRYHREARRKDGSFAAFAVDHFPYFEWLEEICRGYLPSGALSYFNSEWAAQKRITRNKPFFNLCKLAVMHAGASIATEVSAAEALTRYVACMFYALRVSVVIALGAGVILLRSSPRQGTAWLVLAGLYMIAFWVILKNFRFLRFKEVDTVFTACFILSIRREAEEDSKKQAVTAVP